MKSKKAGIDFIISGNYPDHIKNHPIFKIKSSVKKIFPLIGLPNTEIPFDWESSNEVKQVAHSLCIDLSTEISNALQNPNNKIENEYNVSLRRLSENLKHYSSYFMKLIGGAELKLNDNYKISSKITLKRDESLFKAYLKIAQVFADQGIVIRPLEEMENFKSFSSGNIGKNIYKIVFSSDGEKGAWDIATMSMRGITSCQSWFNPQSRGLIGSIMSPFIGVIYVASTSKVDNYGSRMVRRAVVRYALHIKDKSPALLMDRPYPSYEESITKSFKAFLEKESSLKVFTPSDAEWRNYYLPNPNFINDDLFGNGEKTYMDTQIPYKSAVSYPKLDFYTELENLKGKSNKDFLNIYDEIVSEIGLKHLAFIKTYLGACPKDALKYLAIGNYAFNFQELNLESKSSLYKSIFTQLKADKLRVNETIIRNLNMPRHDTRTIEISDFIGKKIICFYRKFLKEEYKKSLKF